MHDFDLTLRWIKTKIENNWCMKMLAPNSAQSVAAAVPRSPELIRALEENAAIAAEEKSLHAEISAVSKSRINLLATPTVDAPAIDARLAAIGVELCDLEKRKQAAAGNIRQHKASYVAAVRASLRHRRHAAAARVVAAIEEFERSSAELDATAKAIQVAGGAAIQLPRFPLISGLKKIAQTIEAEA